MDKILKIESLEDAKEFERVASGRKFCKRGTRVQDICEEEVENYICKTRGNLLLRWYLHRKMKKNKRKNRHCFRGQMKKRVCCWMQCRFCQKYQTKMFTSKDK